MEVEQKPKKEEETLTLTPEQKAEILTLINSRPLNPPGIKECTEAAFGPGFDGRSLQGKTVKYFLATLNIKARSSFDPKYSKGVELTEEQKLYIRNNASTATIGEMVQALFNKDGASKISLEYKAIEDFMASVNAKAFEPNSQIIQSARFVPKSLDQAARRVNKYVLNAIDVKNLKKDTRIQNYLQALIRYCHVPRYALLMATLADGIDLELFESSFIRYVWDKPDLTEEEVDTYMTLCCDIVNYTKMQRELEKLSEMRDKCLDDSEGKRLSTALVDAMQGIYKAMDDNQKRQSASVKVLIGARNDRVAGTNAREASVSQLVEAWRDKEKRDRLIAIAERRKQSIKDELGRLDSLDSMKAEIFGLNKESF